MFILIYLMNRLILSIKCELMGYTNIKNRLIQSNNTILTDLNFKIQSFNTTYILPNSHIISS